MKANNVNYLFIFLTISSACILISFSSPVFMFFNLILFNLISSSPTTITYGISNLSAYLNFAFNFLLFKYISVFTPNFLISVDNFIGSSKFSVKGIIKTSEIDFFYALIIFNSFNL